MFEILIYFVYFIIRFALLIAGIIILGYGIYSLTVKGFDRFVRYGSLFLGASLILLTFYLKEVFAYVFL